MKKKNSIAKKINLSKNLYLKNKRILSVYSIFKKVLYKNIKREKFCIGVSGGPDSLALAYLSKIYAKEFNTSFKTLIVNHKIREESTKEAKLVRNILLKKNIYSKILTWNGKTLKSNIQSNARKIRYDLLLKECNKLKINNLVLGHQIEDFIENFLIRLFRGSGLKGLSSFNEVRILNEKNQKIIRPIISIKKKDLIYVCENLFGTYVVDPSNFKDKYLRTRIRNYIKTFKSDGLDIDKVKLTIKNLQIAQTSLDKYYQEALNNYTEILSENKCIISLDLFRTQGEEITFRVMGNIISKIGNSYYPPRGKDLNNIILRMKSNNNFKATLGKCVIKRVNNSFIIEKEYLG